MSDGRCKWPDIKIKRLIKSFIHSTLNLEATKMLHDLNLTAEVQHPITTTTSLVKPKYDSSQGLQVTN